MKIRNKIIIALLIFGVILSVAVNGIVIPRLESNRQKYIMEQRDPLTHDFGSVIKYRNKYMGNASNLINLFHSLPLNNIDMSFQLYPDKLTLEVNYKETVTAIGDNEIDRALIYNATAAFALIGNLEVIVFNFTGVSYKVSRGDTEKWYGIELSTLADGESWKEEIQKNIKDSDYVKECSIAILKRD